MALLEVNDLKTHFRTDDGVVKAVDGVSFTVEKGQTLGIVGESGSGKSVTCLTIMGLNPRVNTITSGQALWKGKDLLRMNSRQLRQIRGDDIAMIFQDPLSSLHPFYKVGKQLVEAVQAHQYVSKETAKERAIEFLGMVGIPDPRRRFDAYPHEFSGGMRQRAMIAMALVNEPRILIADEPTTALDVTVQAQILDLIARLQRELDMAVILITHDLGVVAEVTDTIAVMYAGRIVEHARKEDIFKAPEHPYTWGLLQSIPRLDRPRDEALIPIPGRPPSLINLPSGCHFHPRCPYVGDRQRRIDPGLEPLPDDPGHKVACLLPSETRKRLWQELGAGKEPQEARAEVVEGGLT